MSESLSSTEQVSKILRAAIISAVAALIGFVVAGVGFYAALSKKPQAIAVTDSGRVIPMVPLGKAYVNDSRVVAFAEECTRRAFAHDFKNFRLSLAEASKCFTGDGAKMYMAAMDSLLKDLIEKRMIMSASVETPVVVQGPFDRGGRVVWRVQTKMQLFREGQKERITPQPFVVELEVVRVELEENTRGIGIGLFTVKPASSS